MRAPATTFGSNGWARNVKDVTTPKLPPPPRRPQNRSAFSVALARTSFARREDHVGGDEVVDRQAVRPVSQPTPPPRVRPAIPVPERRRSVPPGRTARSRDRCRRASPLLRPARGGVGVDVDRLQSAEVEDDAVVDRPVAGDVVAAAADRQRQAGRTCERDRRRDVGRTRSLDDHRRVACRSSRSRPVALRRTRHRRPSGSGPGRRREAARSLRRRWSLPSSSPTVSMGEWHAGKRRFARIGANMTVARRPRIALLAAARDQCFGPLRAL